MLYYLELNGKIILFDESKDKLLSTISLMPQYQGLEIKETERPIVDFQFADTQEYKEEQERIKRERLNMLSLTKREVFLALYKAKKITPEQLRTQITDTEALIEFDFANEYFRGNPLIDKIGIMLGYSMEDLDYLFVNKQLPSEENSTDTTYTEEENTIENQDT